MPPLFFSLFDVFSSFDFVSLKVEAGSNSDLDFGFFGLNNLHKGGEISSGEVHSPVSQLLKKKKRAQADRLGLSPKTQADFAFTEMG